jgi:hypothetical protein
MRFFEIIFKNFKTKIKNTPPIHLFFGGLLGILIVYGFIIEFILSINLHLSSDGVETGIVSMEIWRHQNFLLNQFYLPSSDPYYFSETLFFQLIPQIISNFSPFVLKIVSFIIFILVLTIFGYIVYIISKKIICTLVFFALMLNLTPYSYIFFNGPSNHIATIFFIGIFIILIFHNVHNNLLNSIIFITLLNLIVFSDSLIILWFIIPWVLYNVYFYKQLTKQSIFFIASAVITSFLTYLYKTYFNSNLFIGYTQLSFLTSFEQLSTQLMLYLKGLVLLLNGNLYNIIFNTQNITLLDYSLILVLILLFSCFVYHWRIGRCKNFFYSFAFFSGVVISFLYIYVSTISVDIGTTRYLTFLAILIFMVLSIECKKNHIMLALLIIIIVINASSNFSAISIIQKPNLEQLDMIDFLKSNQLSTGYGDYWDSNLITYLSNEQITIRSVLIINDQITPFYWVSGKEEYNVSSEKGYFILVKSNGHYLNINSTKNYLNANPPNKALYYSNYNIYIYNEKPRFDEQIYFHQIGHLIEERETKFIEVFPNEGKGFVLFGPKDRIRPGQYLAKIPPGQYLVDFYIDIDNSSNNSGFTSIPLCKIDVSSQNGKTILAEKIITPNNLTQPNGTLLEFTLYEPENLEYRVWSENSIPFKVGAEPRLIKL